MTKFLTTAAWAALVLGGVATADTPPAESSEVTIEEETMADADAPKDITTVSIGDEIEAEAETETDETAASVVVEGDVAAGGEASEAGDAEMEASETE